MRKYFLFLSMGLLSCTHADDQPRNIVDSIKAAGYTLEVSLQDQQCFLSYSNQQGAGQFPLIAKPPCYFLKNDLDVPQQFQYDDIGVIAVLGVAGTPVSEKVRREWGLEESWLCGSVVQGVVIKADTIQLSGHVIKDAVACQNLGLDEKDFWSFAHHDVEK